MEELTFEAVGGRDLLRGLRSRCETARGKTRFEESPSYRPVKETRELYAAVTAVGACEQIDGCDARLNGFPEELLERSRRSSALDADDLAGVAGALEALLEVRRYFEEKAETRAAINKSLTANIMGSSLLLDSPAAKEIMGAFSSSDKQGVMLLADPSSDLGKARKAVATCQGKLSKAVDDFNVPNEDKKRKKELFEMEKGRFVVAVGAKDASVDRKSFTQRGSSRSGGTVYLEPKNTRTAKDALDLAVEAEAEAVLARLAALTSELASIAAPLSAAAEAAASIDALRARARLGSTWTVPEIGDEGVIELQGFRSTQLLLSAQSSSTENDFSLRGGTALVLSGPNGGGKTTALQSLGLVAFMTRLGVAVPCRLGCRVDVFQRIMGDVEGSAKRLNREQSTYEAHLSFVSSAIGITTGLVLMDELGASTDHAEGGALARASLEALLLKGAKTVICTTHHAKLRELPLVDPARYRGFAFECCIDGKPTFKASPVPFGRSEGLKAAQRCGIPVDVIARAKELLPAKNNTDVEEELWTALLKARAKADAELASASAERAELRAELRRFEQLRERAVEATKRRVLAAAKRVERREKKLDLLFATLQSSKSSPSAVIGETIAAARIATQRSRADSRMAVFAAAGLAPIYKARVGEGLVLVKIDPLGVLSTRQASLVAIDEATGLVQLRLLAGTVNASLADCARWDTPVSPYY